MAELKVKFTGDTKALKRAAQEATQIMGAAAAEGAAAARKADADTVASRREALKQRQQDSKAELDRILRDIKKADDDEKAVLREKAGYVRQELRVRAADLRALAREQQSAIRESSALEKAAIDARRADRQREQAEQRAWIAEQRQAAKDLDREAKKLREGAKAVAQGSMRPGATGEARTEPSGGLTPAGAIGSILTVEVIKKLISTLDRVGDIVRQANEKALGEQERGAATLARREEAFRLAGASPAQARALAAQATASGIEGGALDAALQAFGGSATRVDPEALSRIFRTADQRSIGGALALAGRGVSGAASVDIAGRFYSATRGAQITPEIAGSISRFYAGRELTADEILTNALTAAGVANPGEAARLARPITGTPDILANRQRNDAAFLLQSALGDDAQAYITQERVQAERLRALQLSQDGRSAQQAAEGLAPSFLAPVVRDIGDAVNSVTRVRVENMPRQPAE